MEAEGPNPTSEQFPGMQPGDSAGARTSDEPAGADGEAAYAPAADSYEQLLDRLEQVAQTFGTARELSTIFRALYKFAVASTPARAIFISLMEGDRRVAVYACADDEELDVSQLPPMRLTDSPHSRAIVMGRIVITDDYQAEMAGRQVIQVGMEKDPRPTRSSLVAPMAIMGRTIGSIEVQSTHLAAFKDAHAAAMRMAANLAAVAIENVRLLERELGRAEREAESQKMRSLGQLAAGVAHDFNNSLAAILGRTQLLLRSVRDEAARRNLQVIETAALDAAETVRRIQTFARRTPKEPLTTVSLGRLINDAIQLTRTRWEDDARAHGLHYEIEFTPPEGGGDEIAVNPSEVREILVNLIFNALDAMPQGGRISFNLIKREGSIEIAVSDTGEGIAPELTGRIFEPFFTTKGPQGSGLGLAVSYGIIHRHGGTIDVESEVGHGTTFRLTFPQTLMQARPSVQHQREVPARRVLLVDDEEVVREVLCEMLLELKQEVTEVSSAAEALHKLSSENFDLMITDLSMPVMDGLKLAKEARLINPAMSIILTTGYGQIIPGAQPDLSLIDIIINKPFQLSDLETSLWALCRNREANG